MSTYGMDPYDVSGDLPGVTNPDDDLAREMADNSALTQDPNATIAGMGDTNVPGAAAMVPAGAPPPLPGTTNADALAPVGGTPTGGQTAAGIGAAPEDQLANPAFMGTAPAAANVPAGPGAGEAALAPLPPLPVRPARTGDPAVDAKNEREYSNALDVYEQSLEAHKGALAREKASINTKAADADLTRAQTAANRALKENQEYQRTRADREAEVNYFTQKKAEAVEDLSKGYWDNKSTGDRVWSAIQVALGAIGAGMQNYGAGLVGQVGQAKNQALDRLNHLMDEDLKRKQAKIASAKDDVLEARYGLQTAADNHRAALNEIDAEDVANSRVAAAEVKADLARKGMSEADINQNEVYLAMRKRELEAAQKIHDRQDEAAEKKRHDIAMEQNAHLAATRPRSNPFAMFERKNELAEEKEARGRASQAVNAFDRQWARQHGPASPVGKAADMNTKLVDGIEKARSANPEDQNFALQELARIAKGGTLTQFASQKDNAYLGGTIDQVQAFFNKSAGEALPPEMQDRLIKSYKIAIDGTVKTAARGRSADSNSAFAPNSGLYGIKGNVENAFERTYGQFRDADGNPVFKTERDQNAPAIDVATGRTIHNAPGVAGPKPAEAKPAPAKAKGKPSQVQIDQAYEALNDPNAPKSLKGTATQVLIDADLI